jgi:hypothetical protein
MRKREREREREMWKGYMSTCVLYTCYQGKRRLASMQRQNVCLTGYDFFLQLFPSHISVCVLKLLFVPIFRSAVWGPVCSYH